MTRTPTPSSAVDTATTETSASSTVPAGSAVADEPAGHLLQQVAGFRQGRDVARRRPSDLGLVCRQTPLPRNGAVFRGGQLVRQQGSRPRSRSADLPARGPRTVDPHRHAMEVQPRVAAPENISSHRGDEARDHVSIETSTTKLFGCLTGPTKWSSSQKLSKKEK